MNSALCKRVIDLILAIVGITLALPIFAIVSLLIWLDDRGPVFFLQTRLGLHGRPFQLLKFRKFYANCGDSGPGVTVSGDARITTVGAVLERTKLDELPQLWNILKGDMSFVGPRPESLRFADLFEGEYARLLDFLPGLFGPCQVAFRNEAACYPADEEPENFYRRVLFPQKATIDLKYFSESTCLTDLNWIFRGILVTIIGVTDWRTLWASYGKEVGTDVIIVILSWIIANILRFSGIPPEPDFTGFIFGLWVIPLVLIAGLTFSGCYRNLSVADFGFADAIRLISATSISWICAFLAILVFDSRTISFYLLPIEWLVLLPALTMPRIWLRWQSERRLTANKQLQHRNILIYGADSNGIALAKWISRGPLGIRRVLAFFDDKLDQQGKRLLGCPVLSRESEILTLHTEHNINEIWVVRRLPPHQREGFADFCSQHGINLVMLSETEPFSWLAEFE